MIEGLSYSKTLLQVMEFVRLMRFPNNQWKPVQCGIRLSTSSILSLHQRLCSRGPLEFMLSRRFTQDALENLFGQVSL